MKNLLAIILATLIVGSTSAQIPGLGKGKLKLPDLGVDSLFKKGPAITTNLKDAVWEVADRDSFNPKTDRLSSLPRGPHNGFILKEGAFSADLQSYCLHAGTYGPGKGEAYLYAPPRGPYEKIVSALVENSVLKPDVPQHDIQLLLWAMMARTKFTDLNRDLQVTAAQLLTTKQLSDLNGGAMGFISDELMSSGLVKQPPFVRQVLEAENQLRRALTSPTATFSDMERIAVLTGVAPKGEGSRETPRGRWSLHPDGFYVRYIPSGYSRTHIEVFVEPGSKAIGKEFNPATQIAVPCETSRQRLLQSGRLFPGT
ncbi:MAG: hypothetical protein K8R88_06230 [Armatimonadetes bacterium]|nr:hypothetical protein [Armatimonadota bacterium]